jgi:hypothetical protein
MKVRVHDPGIEIMSVKRDKKKGDFIVESHADVSVLAEAGELVRFEIDGLDYKIKNDNGDLVVIFGFVELFRMKG